MSAPIQPILPGATLGLLGGGQLARMTALAARAMGYRVAVVDPDPACAASPVADVRVTGAFDDPEAAARLASHSDVVTYEIERFAPAALQAAARLAPLRPRAEVLAIIQDRARQKTWLQAHGYPVGPWMLAESAADLDASIRALGPCRAKRTQGGYDGRSQVRVPHSDQVLKAWQALGGPAVAEQELDLALELSVLVARTPSGAIQAHPPALNRHAEGQLVHSLFPAPGDRALLERLTTLAKGLAEDLGVEGLLAVEFFVTTRGEVLVNELSPRPHNTFHGASAACATGQFEQYVRAVCNLPLGSTETHGTSVLVNLLGDLWFPQAPPIPELMALPGLSIHLYGKTARPRRKVGHLVAWAENPHQAVARAEAAMALLGIGSTLASAS